MTDVRITPATRALFRALTETLGSAVYAAALDSDRERAWLLTKAACDGLHPLGPVTLPSSASLEKELNRAARDKKILEGFKGNNYEELARKHHLSVRQVRRIVEDGRGKR